MTTSRSPAPDRSASPPGRAQAVGSSYCSNGIRGPYGVPALTRAGSRCGYGRTVSLPRVLVLVLAGGAGGRLELLTEERAKPAVPFAGVYRLIDFPLSNCLHSGIADVWVSIQFHPTSLSSHLANGRPWDLDRSVGGLMTLPPFQGNERGGGKTGTADSLWREGRAVPRLRAAGVRGGR